MKMCEDESRKTVASLRRTELLVIGILAVLCFPVEVGCQQTNANAVLFDPKVTASCSEFPYMKIFVSLNQPFYGVIHAKDYRTDACQVYGAGGPNVTLVLNVLAGPNDGDYCGVRYNDENGERTVPIYVRYHRTLERIEDKVFSISCNNPGYMNSRNEISRISMAFVEDNKKTQEVVKGHQYILRIQETSPDSRFHLKVKKCFSFGVSNDDKIDLTDDRGCPLSPEIMTRFKYNEATGAAEAIVFSMFKFQDTRQVHVNCLVAVCRGKCIQDSCDWPGQGRSVEDDNAPYQFWTAESAYVMEPGEPSALVAADCSLQRYSWLLGLCIAFGILFLIMLIVNVLLCSALTCSCAKQEVIEREPSVIEDYDPYKGGWSGSQYSLNGKPGYVSGGSTLNSTTRSISTNSDHYAMVHSHPGTRYGSGLDDRSSKNGYHRGPESTLSHGRL